MDTTLRIYVPATSPTAVTVSAGTQSVTVQSGGTATLSCRWSA